MEGDSIRETPRSRIADALRKFQEQQAAGAADPARPSALRVLHALLGAVPGKAADAFDAAAAGESVWRMPKPNESFYSANEAPLDAAGLVPDPAIAAGKAVFMGGKMLRAVGRGEEFREASEHLLDKGEAPLGWIVHPGGRKDSPNLLMKYEPPKLKKDVAWAMIARAKPDEAKAFEYLYEPTDFFAAYKGATGNPLRLVPKNTKLLKSQGSYSPSANTVNLGKAFHRRVAGASERLRDLALQDLLAHELTHAGQAASNLPANMRGGSPRRWLPSPTEEYLQTLPTQKLSSALSPEEFAQEVIRLRLDKTYPRLPIPEDVRPKLAANQARRYYEANPGETIARVGGLLGSAEDRAGGWSDSVRNYNLRQQMRPGSYTPSSRLPDLLAPGTPEGGLGSRAKIYPTIQNLYDEATTLRKQLRAQREAQKRKAEARAAELKQREMWKEMPRRQQFLLNFGSQPLDDLEARKAWSNGDHIFAFHEQGWNDPVRVTSPEMLEAYTPDQLMIVPKKQTLPDVLKGLK